MTLLLVPPLSLRRRHGSHLPWLVSLPKILCMSVLARTQAILLRMSLIHNVVRLSSSHTFPDSAHVANSLRRILEGLSWDSYLVPPAIYSCNVVSFVELYLDLTKNLDFCMFVSSLYFDRLSSTVQVLVCSWNRKFVGEVISMMAPF